MDETATTPEVTTAAEGTPEVQAPAPEVQAAPPEPDWKQGYAALQTNLNKAIDAIKNRDQQIGELADALKVVKETQSALAKTTLGEDEFKALETRQQQAMERAQVLQGQQASEQFVIHSIATVTAVMRHAGVPEGDIGEVFKTAQGAPDAAEWARTVQTLAGERIAKAKEAEIKAETGKLTAKMREEIKVEAEALLQRERKQSGVEKIDTGSNGKTASLAERIRDMDPASPEFQRVLQQAKRGQLR